MALEMSPPAMAPVALRLYLAAFKKYDIKRVLIAYDRDDAGNKSAEQLAQKLQSEGIDCFRILLPKGMDVNEYVQQVTPAQKNTGPGDPQRGMDGGR
jgi:hypothetical protein